MYGTNSYLPGVLVLAASLKEVGSPYPLVVLVAADEVGPATTRALEAAGCLIERAEPPSRLDAAGGLGSGQGGASSLVGPGAALEELGAGVWLKLHLWRMAFDRVVYLDADAFVLRNIDELFTLRGDAHARPSGARVSER